MCCCFYLHSRWPDLTYGSSLTGIALKTVTRSVFYLNNDEAGRQRSFRDRYSHGLPGFPEDRRHQAFHEDPVCKEGTLLLINFNLITEMQFHLVTGGPGKRTYKTRGFMKVQMGMIKEVAFFYELLFWNSLCLWFKGCLSGVSTWSDNW